MERLKMERLKKRKEDEIMVKILYYSRTGDKTILEEIGELFKEYVVRFLVAEVNY